MAAPYVKNLIISGGADFSQSLFFSGESGPTNLSGYTIHSHLRKNNSSSSFKEFDISVPEPSSGELKMFLSAEHTSNLKPGRYVYDILFEKPDQTKSVLLEGSVLVTAGISTGCF